MEDTAKPTILLVDDTEMHIDILANTLDEYDISVATDGESALEAVDSEPPDLMLLDIMMPGIDGYEVCRRLKLNEATKNIPVIFLTAKNSENDEMKGFIAGAVDYITKPLSPPIIKARVMTHLSLLHARNKLEKQNKQLEHYASQMKTLTEAHRMASLGTIAAGVAHEINNPLNIAAGYIHIVRRDLTDLVEIVKRYSKITLPPEKSEEIENLKKEIDLPYLLDNFDDKPSRCEGALRRIQDIVKNLGDFAHLDKKEIAAININTSIESALKVIPEKQKQNIEVETEFAQLPSISCCGREINQVFMNVIINALQMMKSEGTLKIKTLLEDSKYAVIIISDTGPGIPVDKIKYIFDPFYTTKPVGEGTGLGLATCYSIMEKHGGSITAVNNPAKGATFTIKLLTKGIKNEPR